MKPQIFLTSLFATVVISACASTPQNNTANHSQLKTEIDLLEARLQDATNKQFNILAPKNFELAKEYRNEAREKLEKSKNEEKVRDDIANSKFALTEVERIGSMNAPIIRSVLSARMHALNIQAQKHQEKKFNSAESDLADMGRTMEKGKFKMDAEDLTKLSNKYLSAEIESRKIALLKIDHQKIEQAEKDGAKDRVPATLETVKVQLSAAERAIEISPHSADGYSAQVAAAHSATLKLQQVLDIAKNNNASEQAALTLWDQNEKIQAANAALEKANAEAASELARLEEKSSQERDNMLAASSAEKNRLENELAENATKIETQTATVAALRSKNNKYANQEELKMKIEELRKTFNPEEAEVVKNGNNLVVRLKQMQFSSGRTELKPEGYNTLKKVEDLIAAVPTKKIIVEGHTDSSGTTVLNQALSEKRAESVKKYLESQNLAKDIEIDATGYGSNRPLTTNKTKKGRASNRRVDIVIETPVVL